jgi:hypothetical protein
VVSPGTPFPSTNNTDRHDITEILFKVALNTITLTPTGLYNLENHQKPQHITNKKKSTFGVFT